MGQTDNESKSYKLIIIDDFPITGTDGYGDTRADLYSQLCDALITDEGIKISHVFCLYGYGDNRGEHPRDSKWKCFDPQGNNISDNNGSEGTQYYCCPFDFSKIAKNRAKGDQNVIAETVADEIVKIVKIVLEFFENGSAIVLVDKSLCPKKPEPSDLLVATGNTVSKILVEKLKKVDFTTVLRYTAIQAGGDDIGISWTAVTDFAFAISSEL